MKNGRDPVIVGLADAPIEDGKFVTKASVLGHAALVAKAAVEEAGLTLFDPVRFIRDHLYELSLIHISEPTRPY